MVSQRYFERQPMNSGLQFLAEKEGGEQPFRSASPHSANPFFVTARVYK